MKIKIGPFWWTVVYTDSGLLEDSDGRCEFAALTIWVRKTLSPQIQREVLLHEIQHACAFVVGDPIPMTQQEKLFSADTGVMLSALRDNPHLINFLTEQDESY